MSNVEKKVNMQASSQNLLQALEATNLALPLGVLVAQRQTSLLFKEDLTHLKLVSNLYDEVRPIRGHVVSMALVWLTLPWRQSVFFQCQETLLQYSDFLGGNIDGESYNRMFPPVADLCEQYHLEPRAAFVFSRPAFAARVKVRGRRAAKLAVAALTRSPAA